MKGTHKQTKELVKRIWKVLIQNCDEEIVYVILRSTIYTAVEFGNYEIIKECILVFPNIWTHQLGAYELFLEAIKNRQGQVYRLVYQMSTHKVLVFSEVDENLENILHIAAKLVPPHILNTVTGAALQMQRELQWFQEVDSIVGPLVKEELNCEYKTPKMVFDDEHIELLKQGKEWMKDTASSSTVVAALIVTVAFAAIFTLPGGDANKGKIAFTLFIISDAIALFSSATSVLLFLGILTSRYAQKDFLQVLPRILMGGLFSLFLSLAATMITFSATVALVLQREMPWIAAPLVVIRSIPIGMFVVIQSPLLVELFNSTYGPNIFRK
ncbi:hypothetical protein OSB04_010162 [Centaurea solstitialis]|uniref:PGG domain-containing protein n=1 Tax=Centaurea solstitialis TaxID=347529 RepID=A0AA38TRU6_9ASTR|nr:hypothetical protein OSB04_010162 [Centaurea solstitialis]